MKTLLRIVFCFTILCSAVLAELLLCNDCGHEYEPGATVCLHCGAPLAPSANDATSETQQKPTNTLSVAHSSATALKNSLPISWAKKEFKRAQQAANLNEPLLAVYIARNSLALAAGSNADAETIEKKVQKFIDRCENIALYEEMTCPACKGDGKGRLILRTLSGEYEQHITNRGCKICHGSGTIPAFVPEKQLAEHWNSARRSFDDRNEQMNLEQLGEAWVPAGTTEKIDLKTRCRVMRTAARYCKTCHGMGFVTCSKCNGSGIIACKNKDCVQGKEICSECKGSTRSNRDKKGTLGGSCRYCQGKGIRTCPYCLGKAVTKCKSCFKGRKSCKSCDGTGYREKCTSCNGAGWHECKRCKGSGIYKDATCSSCAGTGIVRCKSCGGDGHKGK